MFQANKIFPSSAMAHRNEIMTRIVQLAGGMIIPLPQERQGAYLFGGTKTGRAVCLASGEFLNGRIDGIVLRIAAKEILREQLQIPCLFFFRSSLCIGETEEFKCVHLCELHAATDTCVLVLLQDMERQNNLRPIASQAIQTFPVSAEALAQLHHEIYEGLAGRYGYRTRDDSAVSWSQVPEPNRGLMIATCRIFLPIYTGQKQIQDEGR